MTNYNWNYPTTVWVGKDRAKHLEKACTEIKTLKPLLVTDRDLINLEFLKDLINDLEKKFKLCIFFICPFPIITNILKIPNRS